MDPRLTNFLALARERSHPYYSAAAYTLARKLGDEGAMSLALSLGAALYRPEAGVYMRAGEAEIIQLAFWEEAA